MGVISLHCFQSSVPAEAYTREGCMLEALGEWGMGFGGTGPTFLYGSRGMQPVLGHVESWGSLDGVGTVPQTHLLRGKDAWEWMLMGPHGC